MEVMGHVKETPNTQATERKLKVNIVGYDASWRIVNGVFRVYVRDIALDCWRGVYLLNKEDLEVY